MAATVTDKSTASLAAATWFRDRAVTLTCWFYFTLGFVFMYGFRYLVACFSPGREEKFQYLTHLFYKRFFRILRRLAPSHRWMIDEEIQRISSSIILCNHLSYLDPLLLISLLPRQKTIVKTVFFKVPVFGRLIRYMGYFPADSHGRYGSIMLEQVEDMDAFLSSGGNLFIFPEGTRSRTGTVQPLNRGALKIARMCRAPIRVLYLAGTEKLFEPGRFFFHTTIDNSISLQIVDQIDAATARDLSLPELEERVRGALLRHNQLQTENVS
jgi:1-acyl-sn-glycerol-3-phosphate acyltransferase